MDGRRSLAFSPYLDGYYDAAPQLQMHVYRRSEEQFAHWERIKDGLTTPERVVAWQQHVRERAIAALGGLPSSDTPLDAVTLGVVHGPDFDVERVIFQSMPEVYVTANVYVPRRRNERRGAVIFLCGHAEEAKTWPPYQAVCQRLARNGLLVLAIDPIGQGERKSYLDANGAEIVPWGPAEHSYAGWQCWWLGQSIARYFVHDVRRAIDYLSSRPDVDPARIGLTGNSGGGTQTAWTMLVEPRLAAASPATFLTQRRAYLWSGRSLDAEQHLLGGTLAGIDHEDCLIAMAPRPVLVLAVGYDYFPIEGTVAAVERARRAYRVLGRDEHLGLLRARSTHGYHPDLARGAVEFFIRHLAGLDPSTADHREPEPLPADPLRCTRSGQVALDWPRARRVFDLNRAEYLACRQERPDPRQRAEAGRQWLWDVVHRHRRPVPFHPRWLPVEPDGDVDVQHGFWWTEPDILNAGCLLRPIDAEYDALTLVLLERGTLDLDTHADALLARARAGAALLVLDVRGTGAVAPRATKATPGGGYGDTPYKLFTDLLWLDDSLAAMQLYDVLQAVELISTDAEIGLGGRPISVLCVGTGAYRGYLAAALDPRLTSVELVGPLPDLSALLTERVYAPPSAVPGNLPVLTLSGLARHLVLEDLRPLSEGRVVRSAGELAWKVDRRTTS